MANRRSLNEIVQVLAGMEGRGFDIPYKESLKVIVDDWRVSLIRQSLTASPLDRKFFYQSGVYELEEVDGVECGEPSGCTVLRTVEELPIPVRANNMWFDFAGTADFKKGFTQNETWQADLFQSLKWIGKDTKFAMRNGYGYIIGDLEMTSIGITGVFENWRQVRTCLTSNNCYTDDDEYPCTLDVVQRVRQAIMGTELRAESTNDTEVKVDAKGSA